MPPSAPSLICARVPRLPANASNIKGTIFLITAEGKMPAFMVYRDLSGYNVHSDGLFCLRRDRLDIEFDALRQRQLLGIVDRIGLTPHIGFPGVTAAFPAAARFLFPAECAPYL